MTAWFLVAVILMLIAGIYSLIRTRNLMRILISAEVLMKAVTLMFVGAGYLTGRMAEVQAMLITIVVIEVMLLVVLTGILLGAYHANDTLRTEKLNNLKG
ncbi:MAG: NADH-quinone oxidoreductase subunit K [Clostridiales bacterium]|nr:NADH-quinone oxidoreductase subunit K [Clostridiales bacterium]